MPTTSLSADLADFASRLTYQELPGDVQEHARLLTLDALGCGLVGSTTEEFDRLRRGIRAMSGEGGNCALWGTNDTAPLPLAVMANGVAVHTREIDDFSLAYHAGSVVIPAAVGVAAAVGATGSELLAAVAAGYETSFRIAQGGAPEGTPGFLPFKKKGWHSTALFGPFGAAVAAAKLLGLDAEGIKWAIGLAGSAASGTWAFIDEGNTIKRVHPGLAAKSGVVAAYLAREGITGPSKILEAEWGGFYGTHLQGQEFFPQHVTGKLGSEWQILHAGFKPYASCRRIHGPLDALFAIVAEHGVRPDQVRKITVFGNAIHQRQLSKYPVTTVLEAQFSLPYTLASALTTGSAGLDQYTQDALRRSEIPHLARLVSVVIDPELAETGEPRVEVELADGRTLYDTAHVPKGHPKNPLSPSELTRKLRTNAGLVLSPEQVDALDAATADLASISNVRNLVALMSPSSAGVENTSARASAR